MTGVEFREIREKLGMTQDTLSKEIGINIRQISRIETGEADVRDYHEKLILTLLEKRSKTYKNDVKTQKITIPPMPNIPYNCIILNVILNFLSTTKNRTNQ